MYMFSGSFSRGTQFVRVRGPTCRAKGMQCEQVNSGGLTNCQVKILDVCYINDNVNVNGIDNDNTNDDDANNNSDVKEIDYAMVVALW